ncbi:MAG TPA: AI-2E family transporter [Jatrophihabitans sp.]|jgi:predicted PurR-regulated permease PerM
MSEALSKDVPAPGLVEAPPTRDAGDTVTWAVRVGAAWAWRLLLLAALVYVLARIAHKLELVAVSFVLALFFAAVLHPLAHQIARVLPKPRSIAPALALIIGLAILGGIGWFVVWQISRHSDQLSQQLSDVVDNTRNWLKTGPLHIDSSDLDNIAKKITDAIQQHQSQLISGAVATVQAVVEGLGALLLILLSTFFLLRDGEQVWKFVLNFVPKSRHAHVDHAGRAGWGTLGGYMRGQLIIALFHGVSVTVILLILQVPLAAALGVLIFLGSFIPLIGLTVTGVLCVAVALLEHGVGAAIVVAVAIVVLLQLEAHLLQPLIMSRSVAVHPLAIALSVISGTIVAGVPGALLAVPFVAFLNTTIRALKRGPEAAADMAAEAEDEQPGGSS